MGKDKIKYILLVKMTDNLVIVTDTPLPTSPTSPTASVASNAAASVAASVAASIKKEEEPKLKKIHKWSREQEILISEWSDLGMCYRWLHDTSEKFFHSKNRWINIPVIILSTLAGTANFGVQSIFSDPASKQLASFAIGGVSLIAGLLTTIGNYLRYAQLEEGNRVSSIAWGKFQRQMAVELALDPKDRTDSMEFLKMCRVELNRLIEQSPPIPAGIIKLFEEKFGQVPNLTRPDICGSLEHTRIFEAPLDDSMSFTLQDSIREHIEHKMQEAIDERKKRIEEEIELKKMQLRNEEEELKRVMEERQKRINDEIELEKQKASEVKKQEPPLKRHVSTIEVKSYFSKIFMK